MGKRILLQYHIWEREYVIIEIIRKELEKLGNIVEFADFMDVESCLEFEPDIIVTHPIRTSADAKCLSLMKVATNAIIIPMVVEGYYNWNNVHDATMMVGKDKCPRNLIDYYIEWGNKTAKIEGECLYRENKISNIDKIKVFGYVPYEIKKMEYYHGNEKMLQKYTDWKKKYQNIVLVLTGFHDANQSINDIYIENGFSAEKGTNEYREEEEFYIKYFPYIKKYQEAYIKDIEILAKTFPNKGIILKMHPIEIKKMTDNKSIYHERIGKYPNVLILDEAFPNSKILTNATLLIHYGSTSALEAYIYEVPTILLTEKKWSNLFPVAGDRDFFYGTDYVDINNREELIKRIEDKIKFEKNEKIEKVLYDGFNWKKDKVYNPSEKIAQFLNGKLNKSNLDIHQLVTEMYVPRTFLMEKRKYIIMKLFHNIVLLKINEVKKYYRYFCRLCLSKRNCGEK